MPTKQEAENLVVALNNLLVFVKTHGKNYEDMGCNRENLPPQPISAEQNEELNRLDGVVCRYLNACGIDWDTHKVEISIGEGEFYLGRTRVRVVRREGIVIIYSDKWLSYAGSILGEAEELYSTLNDSAERLGNQSSAGTTTDDVWPPDNGWHFQPGEAAYMGKTLQLLSREHKILKLLTDYGPQRRKLATDILDEVWEDSTVVVENVSQQVSNLNRKLRTTFNLSADVQIIKGTGSRADLAYGLNPDYEVLISEGLTNSG